MEYAARLGQDVKEGFAAVADACDKVKGQAPTPGDVVAGATFSFWRGFFLPQFEEIWRAVMSDAFPNVPPAHAKCKTFNTRVDEVRVLRNSVFHHEPIFRRQDLTEKHQRIHEMLGWLSAEALAELEKLDIFSATFANDPRTTRYGAC